MPAWSCFTTYLYTLSTYSYYPRLSLTRAYLHLHVHYLQHYSTTEYYPLNTFQTPTLTTNSSTPTLILTPTLLSPQLSPTLTINSYIVMVTTTNYASMFSNPKASPLPLTPTHRPIQYSHHLHLSQKCLPIYSYPPKLIVSFSFSFLFHQNSHTLTIYLFICLSACPSAWLLTCLSVDVLCHRRVHEDEEILTCLMFIPRLSAGQSRCHAVIQPVCCAHRLI